MNIVGIVPIHISIGVVRERACIRVKIRAARLSKKKKKKILWFVTVGNTEMMKALH